MKTGIDSYVNITQKRPITKSTTRDIKKTFHNSIYQKDRTILNSMYLMSLKK